MTNPETFSVARFAADGEFLDSEQIAFSILDSDGVQYFQERFKHLSGDLDLPLEEKLPGEFDSIEYRIGSDLNGAFVLYYFHDDVVAASLMLSGTNEVAETELMQVFKFLLLDDSDDEEPTEEEIDDILSDEAYDFFAITERPIVYEIQFGEPSDESRHITKINRQMSAAFFAIDRTDLL